MKARVTIPLIFFSVVAMAADPPARDRKGARAIERPGTRPAVTAPGAPNDFRSKNAADMHARARQLVEENKAADAVQVYRTLLSTEPEMDAARRDLGKLLLQIRDNAAAQKEFEELVRRNAGDADAHFNLGIAQYRLGQTSQGIASMVEALRLKPDFAEARKNLGAVFLTENR